MSRQKKLNLHSPYLAISDSLWHSKQANSHQEKENTRLRTKVYKMTHSMHPNTPEDAENQRLADKFKKLAQQHKQEVAWIKDTEGQIDERHYEQLLETVKTLENKLRRESGKTLKLEKTVRRNLLRAQSQPTDAMEASPRVEDCLEQLEVDKRQLEQLLAGKQAEAQAFQQSSKSFNFELIQLLNIKNALREEARLQMQSKGYYASTSV